MSQSGIEQLMPVLTPSVPSLVRTKTYAQPLSNTGEVSQPNVDEYHILMCKWLLNSYVH